MCHRAEERGTRLCFVLTFMIAIESLHSKKTRMNQNQQTTNNDMIILV